MPPSSDGTRAVYRASHLSQAFMWQEDGIVVLSKLGVQVGGGRVCGRVGVWVRLLMLAWQVARPSLFNVILLHYRFLSCAAKSSPLHAIMCPRHAPGITPAQDLSHIEHWARYGVAFDAVLKLFKVSGPACWGCALPNYLPSECTAPILPAYPVCTRRPLLTATPPL
jgi:hypothetical protein